ncbi:MAG: TIGR03943 family protein [Microcella sp.]|nr:TIGR03943 family protein [Microcella sp.]
MIISTMAAITLWLAYSGQLVLYIHPRYIVFTVTMAVIAVVLSVLAVTSRRDHDDEHETPAPRRERMLGLTAATIAGLFTLGMVVIPPATLSTATAEQREVNATASTNAADLEQASTADAEAIARFTVREWSSVLRQTSDLAFFDSKPATALLGFVTPDSDDPDNLFYVSRFVVTCCAVDAQPLGVPVYLPGWQSTLETGSWVEVTGPFASNPSRSSSQAIVIVPDSVEAVDQPREPYLF